MEAGTRPGAFGGRAGGQWVMTGKQEKCHEQRHIVVWRQNCPAYPSAAIVLFRESMDP